MMDTLNSYKNFGYPQWITILKGDHFEWSIKSEIIKRNGHINFSFQLWRILFQSSGRSFNDQQVDYPMNRADNQKFLQQKAQETVSLINLSNKFEQQDSNTN